MEYNFQKISSLDAQILALFCEVQQKFNLYCMPHCWQNANILAAGTLLLP